MTKDEFIDYYANNSKVTRKFIIEHMDAYPCECDYENCRGWQMISQDSRLFKITDEDK